MAERATDESRPSTTASDDATSTSSNLCSSEVTTTSTTITTNATLDVIYSGQIGTCSTSSSPSPAETICSEVITDVHLPESSLKGGGRSRLISSDDKSTTNVVPDGRCVRSSSIGSVETGRGSAKQRISYHDSEDHCDGEDDCDDDEEVWEDCVEENLYKLTISKEANGIVHPATPKSSLRNCDRKRKLITESEKLLSKRSRNRYCHHHNHSHHHHGGSPTTTTTSTSSSAASAGIAANTSGVCLSCGPGSARSTQHVDKRDHVTHSWRRRLSQTPSSAGGGSAAAMGTMAAFFERRCDGGIGSTGIDGSGVGCSIISTCSTPLCGGSGGGGGCGSSQPRTPRAIIPTKDNPPPELCEWLGQFQHWSHAERILAINELITRCEPTQVRHMMQVIEPQFQRDFISLLPRELALSVLAFLEPRDLVRAAQTCRSWRYLAEDNLLWREKCREAGIELPAVAKSHTPRSRARRRHRRRQLRRCVMLSRWATGKCCGTTVIGNSATGTLPGTSAPVLDTPPVSPWKAAYMRHQAILKNWCSNELPTAKLLKGHDDHVITCLQFNGNKIVSGSDDNTLKVWSATTGRCLRTLIGHTGGVWSSQMADDIIISGSTDRTLKVWDADSGICLHTLYGHTSTVRCMHLHKGKVVSGSRDATLRVWDIHSGRCLHILVGHQAAVRCVQYDGRLVVSGAYDFMVKVWCPESEECLHTLQGHTNRVYSLQFDGVHVVSGSLDTSIRVWEVETGALRHTLMGHQSLTSGMELRNNILVSGNADSTVKVWDIITGQCLQTLSGSSRHQSAVTCLQFNNRFVITSSDDGTVKLWDVHTGEFIRNLVALDSGGSGGVVWRIRANGTKLVCAVGSRNGTEETKLLVLDFDVPMPPALPPPTCYSGEVVANLSSSSGSDVTSEGSSDYEYMSSSEPEDNSSDNQSPSSSSATAAAIHNAS